MTNEEITLKWKNLRRAADFSNLDLPGPQIYPVLQFTRTSNLPGPPIYPDLQFTRASN